MSGAGGRRHGFLIAGASVALAVHGHVCGHGRSGHIHVAGLDHTHRKPGGESHREQNHKQPTCEFRPHGAKIALRSASCQGRVLAAQLCLSQKLARPVPSSLVETITRIRRLIRPENWACFCRPDVGTIWPPKRWKMLAKASLCCHPASRSGAMGRLLVLLLLAVGLTVPTAARSGVQTDTRIEAKASAATQLAAPANAKRTAIPCRGCTKRKACSAYAIACSAYCAAASALLPDPVVLATTIPSGASASIPSAPEGFQRPPDPYPPRPILIS